MRVPIEVVVDGVIDSTVAFTTVPNIERRNSKVIDEDGIVRSGPQGIDAQISALTQFLTIRERGVARGGRGGFGFLGQHMELQPLPNGEIRFGILNVARHAVHELLEGVRPRYAQKTPAIPVRVDVYRRFTA